jgi:hypothetical protein
VHTGSEKGREVKKFEDARKVTPQQLKGMTEPQVDELFAATWGKRYDLVMDMLAGWNEVHYAVGDRRMGGRAWRLDRQEVQEKAAGTEKGRKALDRVNRIKEVIAALDREVLAKLDGEFDRRGKWERAHLVTDGHVHSSQGCSTCNNGEFPTRFHWLIDYSGKSQEEVIEAAGERACSICYPDAPVNRGQRVVPKSVMLTPEEIERAQVRGEEAARRAEKKARASLGAITQPDGTPLRDEMGTDGKQRGSVVKTLRTARMELKRECWYQYGWDDSDGRHERNIQHLAKAIAWKENGLDIGIEPTLEQITSVIEPLRNKATREVDKARQEGR